MKEKIKAKLIDLERSISKYSVDFVSKEKIKEVRDFHRKFDEYRPTPLYSLDGLAIRLGLKGIFVKDESQRFGLNAFKVLGASYAMARFLADKLDMYLEDLSFSKLRSEEFKKRLGEITFVTATDGNHGRGVAWAARQLGQKSVVYMPRGSSLQRLEAIRKEGAKASIIEGNYDDAVRLADEMAKEHGWIVIQDTAWPGYEDIPRWIMQGYGTLIDEAIEQLEEVGVHKPSHVFLQAGVGSFAGAIQAYLVSSFGVKSPMTIILEPRDADCLYRSAQEGRRVIVEGDMPTIMAGLACGEPNTQAYEILRDYSRAYLSCPDYVAARGMRILAAPLGGDPQVISGESGAVGVGVISLLMERKEYSELRQSLDLGKDSSVLLISTEGDTDPEGYRAVVWDGDVPSI